MSNSDPSLIAGMSTFRRLMATLHERKSWEAQNPELAADWSEALRQDAAWEQACEIEAARRRTELDIPHLLRKLGVPEKCVKALCVLDPDKPGICVAREFVASHERPFLVLLGGAGTGKTVAAAYVLRDQLLRDVGRIQPSGGSFREPARWVSSAELASLSRWEPEDVRWFEECLRVRLLVVDDLASEIPSADVLPRLERLVDFRHGNSLRTVLTSNCDQEAFATRMGERITDRLREGARVKHLGRKSLRGAQVEIRRAPA